MARLKEDKTVCSSILNHGWEKKMVVDNQVPVFVLFKNALENWLHESDQTCALMQKIASSICLTCSGIKRYVVRHNTLCLGVVDYVSGARLQQARSVLVVKSKTASITEGADAKSLIRGSRKYWRSLLLSVFTYLYICNNEESPERKGHSAVHRRKEVFRPNICMISARIEHWTPLIEKRNFLLSHYDETQVVYCKLQVCNTTPSLPKKYKLEDAIDMGFQKLLGYMRCGYEKLRSEVNMTTSPAAL